MSLKTTMDIIVKRPAPIMVAGNGRHGLQRISQSAMGLISFSGLPGLILKARDTRNHNVFELVHVKNAEEYMTIYLDSYRFLYMNRCQYLKAIKHHQDNLAATITAGTVNGDPQRIQEIVERKKRKNNPIELKCD